MSTPKIPAPSSPDWLRLIADEHYGNGCYSDADYIRAAADELDRLRAENERLRKDQNWAAFGKEVFAESAERVATEMSGEEDEAIMEIAAKHGIVKAVAYDPALHGEIPEAEPGDRIWWWGKAKERRELIGEYVQTPTNEAECHQHPQPVRVWAVGREEAQ